MSPICGLFDLIPQADVKEAAKLQAAVYDILPVKECERRCVQHERAGTLVVMYSQSRYPSLTKLNLESEYKINDNS